MGTDDDKSTRCVAPYSNCPFAFNSVLARDIDWLYPYWDGSLANLDAVATWNKSLTAAFKKSAFALTHTGRMFFYK